MTFGDVLFEYRKRKQLRLIDLGAAVGVSPAFISMLENDKDIGTAKQSTLLKIAEVLEIPKRQFIYLAGKVPEEEAVTLKANAIKFFRKKFEKQLATNSKA